MISKIKPFVNMGLCCITGFLVGEHARHAKGLGTFSSKSETFNQKSPTNIFPLYWLVNMDPYNGL